PPNSISCTPQPRTIAFRRACRITISRSPSDRSEPGPEKSNPLKQHRARNSRRPCRYCPAEGYHRCTRPGVVTPFVNRLAGIFSATVQRTRGAHMTTLSVGQAARRTGRRKKIRPREFLGRLFAERKEAGVSNFGGAEGARVSPSPPPAGRGAELRPRLTLAEE